MASWTRYFSALAHSTNPVVMAINGVAAGAGFETALLGDVRIASLNARFLMAEADVGLPAIVGQYLLALHLGRSRATELVLTGRTITAEEARDMGLLRDLVPEADLLEAAVDLARELAAKPAVALRLTLSRFHEALAAGLTDAEAAASLYQSEAVASGAPQAALQAFLAARAARRQASDQK
jgi:enoyl-CoA hydratase/carnithine racemase